MGRRLRIGLLAFALVAVVATGCGGSSSSNDEATKAAAVVFSDAQRAAVAATSVHVAGTITGRPPLSLDLVLAHGKGKGTMSTSGQSFQIVRIGDVAYVKGSDAFLRLFAGAAVAQLLHGKWLKGSVATGNLKALAPLTDITALFKGAFGSSHGKLVNEGETTFQGQKVVAIKDSKDGSILYVAASGTPYPLGAKESGASKGTITFDHWNDSVSIVAPKGAVDIGKLGG